MQKDAEREKNMSEQNESSNGSSKTGLTSPTSTGDVSRRGFLKGIGLGTAATGLLSAARPDAEAAQRDSGIKGPGELPVSLKVNGKTRKLNVEPRVTLLDALRNRLD